jgi:DNA modification methylase
MPESVTDRPTKSHEYIFLMSKSAKYYFDQGAVKEPFQGKDERQWMGSYKKDGSILQGISNAGIKRTKRYPKEYGGSGTSFQGHSGYFKADGTPIGDGFRNIRSVWTVATTPCKDAHFATFPPKLIEPCIKAGTSEKGCCPVCGVPWVRIIERKKIPRDELPKDDPNRYITILTHRWQPTCGHNGDPVPCVVLDPFGGSGTTGVVARNLGRNFILIELNPKYVDMQLKRVTDLFTELDIESEEE